MKPRHIAIVFILLRAALLTAPAMSYGQKLASIEIFFGSALNFRTPLAIEQDGQDDIVFSARYDTRGLSQPLYWAVRFSFQRRMATWELQFVHHKIYLANPPHEVQHFEITHGFNLFTLNRVFEIRAVPVRIGAGFVLAHPKSTVRDLSIGEGGGILGTGYRLTGPAFLMGLGKRFPIAHRLFLALDGQLIGAWARVPVGNGHANAPNASVHGLVGVGYGL